jgi:hypothetical protein
MRQVQIKKKPKKIYFEWGMWFLGRGKQVVKLQANMFDHIYFEVFMTIHCMTIAHYYKADKIVRGMSEEQALKDIIKEASNQLKLAYCKSKYLLSRCSGIDSLPFKDKKPIVELTLNFNNYLLSLVALHH